MAPNSYCPDCRTRVLVVTMPDNIDLMLNSIADPAGTVYLTGDAWYGAWIKGAYPTRIPYAKEPDDIPGHVAFRYRRHTC